MAWKGFKMPKLSRPRLTWLRPSRPMLKKATVAGIVAAAVFGAFLLGGQWADYQARGQAPQQPPLDLASFRPAANNQGGHVVAYIYNNVPITREELGEYLIQRFGPQRLEYLVNAKIIDLACAAKNIHITEQEINAQLGMDLKILGCTEADFVKNILQRYNKTLVEWKEDVIRPKLAMQHYVEKSIAISEEDIRNGYEAKFGPQIECRMIVLSDKQEAQKYDIWKKVRNDADEFEREAKNCFIPVLASKAGMVPPIHKHFADPNLEREAFKLKPGEVSPLIGMPDKTTVILRCERIIEADTTKKLDQVRMDLYHEIFESKVAQMVPETFKKMRDEARPQILLERDMPGPGHAAVAAQGITAPPTVPMPSIGGISHPLTPPSGN
jgi:hypothetical protein